MNAHPRAFQIASALPQSVPVRCLAPMRPQQIEVWTPFSVFGALMMALLYLPRQAVLMPAAIRPDTARALKNRRA